MRNKERYVSRRRDMGVYGLLNGGDVVSDERLEPIMPARGPNSLPNVDTPLVPYLE